MASRERRGRYRVIKPQATVFSSDDECSSDQNTEKISFFAKYRNKKQTRNEPEKVEDVMDKHLLFQRTPHRRKKGKVKYSLVQIGAQFGARPVLPARTSKGVQTDTTSPVKKAQEMTYLDVEPASTSRRSSEADSAVDLRLCSDDDVIEKNDKTQSSQLSSLNYGLLHSTPKVDNPCKSMHLPLHDGGDGQEPQIVVTPIGHRPPFVVITPEDRPDAFQTGLDELGGQLSTLELTGDRLSPRDQSEGERLSVTGPESDCSRRSSSVSLTSVSSSQEDEGRGADVELTRARVNSSWRKIRSVVHCSPFIQQFKKYRYPWVQLAGHQGNFKAGDQGTILKKKTAREQACLKELLSDVLRAYVPEYKGEVQREGEHYIQMQDLLCEFRSPNVMDCKIGMRTYLEDDLAAARKNPQHRKDMYEKMVAVDPDEPTEEERQRQGITKPRYMQWRETLSSTATLGFRIEGIKKNDDSSSRDFKKTRHRHEVLAHFRYFVDGKREILNKYIRRLKAIRATLETSEFFARHEVIGSSLLFVHDQSGEASIWIIDFGKTVELPPSVHIDHRTPWQEGNREDGYLMGVDNIILLMEDLANELNEPVLD